MKKALIVLLALCFVSAMAFADAKWSVKTRYGFGIQSYSSGNELLGYDYSQVGAGRTRLMVNITSEDGNVGFNGRMQMKVQDYASVTSTKGYPVIFSQLNGWAKLFSGMLTVRAGRLDDYTIATPDWNNFGTTDGSFGMYFDVSPMAGLDIGFFQVIPSDGAAVGASANGDIIGLAYAMPNLVSVQAGVILDFRNTAANGHAIYFGADVTAVPNLTAMLEAKVELLNGSTPITLEQNIGYSMGALTVGARIGEVSNSAAATTLVWGVEPTVSYKVNDNVTVNAIANVYNDPGQTFMSPIDAGVVAGGAVGTTNFGGGASFNWIMGGATLTVGDFYAAATGSGNLFYVNLDVNL